MSTNLVEYLKGKTTLVEYNALSPGISSGGGGGMATGRQERLKQSWGDLTIKLEALWLDILDTDEQVYEEAEQTLKDIRATGPEGCKAALPYFKNLTSLLRKRIYVDKYAVDKQLRLFHSRQAQLLEELIYICDEYDPDAPKVPGAPIRSKEQWDLAQKADKADVTFQDPMAPPEEEEPGEEEEDPDMDPDMEPEEEPLDPEMVPDPQAVPGEEEPDMDPDLEPEEDPDRMAPDGDAVEPGAEPDMEPDVPVVPGQEPEEEPEEDPDAEPEEEDPEQVPQQQAPAPVPTQPVQPKPAPAQAPVPGQPPAQAPPGQAPQPVPGKKPLPDFLKKKKKSSKKEASESRLPPETESLVLASFAKAADAVDENLRDVDAEFMEAASTLCAVLKEYTDIHSVYTEVGSSVPGSCPRIDVYVEWEDTSTCYGYGRLWYTPLGLTVYDARDRIREEIELAADTTDESVAKRVYLALETVYDVDPRRVFSESRVIPALYNLLAQARRGIDLPETALASTLQSLRPRLGLQESVRMVSQEIVLNMDEGFEDTYNYHFAWAVQTPLTHVKLPDELGAPDSLDDLPPEDELRSLELYGKKPYVSSAPVRKADDSDFAHQIAAVTGIRERKQGASVVYWRTPGIAVSFRDQAVYLVHEGKKKKIDPDTTDEDITARLASMAYQKEDVETGRIIEGIQVNRRDVYDVQRTALGSVLEQSASSLEQLSTDELHGMAVDKGLKVPGDGVTWSREKLVAYLSGGMTEAVPDWPGASKVYTRAQKMLDMMAKQGHVSVSKDRKKRGKSRRRVTSEDMDALIKALDKGDEEQIKGLMVQYQDRFGFVSTTGS